MKPVHHDSFQRLCRAVAAWICVAAVIALPDSALAATVSLISPTTTGITLKTDASGGTAYCPIANVLGDSQGNLTVTCTGQTPVSGAGMVALNIVGTSTSIPTGGSTTFSVVRTGATTGGGAATATLAVTSGVCTLSTPTVTFADGGSNPTPATVTLSAGPSVAGTSCTVGLTTTGSVVVGTPNSLSVGITAQSAGTLALSLANTLSSITAATGSTTVSVTRNAGTAGSVTGNLAVSGGCTLSAASVSFADGLTTATPASVTVSAGSATAGGSCTVTLTSSSAGVTIGSPSTALISITGPTVAGCPTSADNTVPWTGYQALLNLSSGKSVAVPINIASYPMVSSAYHAAMAESINTQGADIQFTVSNCPGDFAAGTEFSAVCMNHTSAFGGSIDFVVGTATGRNASNVCQIPAGTSTVYFNIRPIKLPTPVPPDAPGTTSCPAGQTCQFYFNLSR